MIRLLSFLLCFAFAFTLPSDNDYPTDFFRSPVEPALLLSGTYGELRPNHFHAGIDIKGSIGQSLYAAGDGYVWRINVDGNGYGNALYIRHPNGFTTLYAHMKEFAPAVQAFVKENQYRSERFEVDLYPAENQFPVRRGDRIGSIGITGSSFGPHLHFEIRDSETDDPINPLLFGLKLNDTQPPRMHVLKVYALNEKGETLKDTAYPLWSPAVGRYRVKGDTLLVASRYAGLGLKAFDHMDGVTNWNGVFSLSVQQGDSTVFEFDMERFAFKQTRYLNAHLDYEEQVSQKSYFYRCFRLPGNALSIYRKGADRGILELPDGKAVKMTIHVDDVKGNTSKLTFWVKKDGQLESGPPEAGHYFLPYDQASLIDNYYMIAYFPEGTLYEDISMQYFSAVDSSSNIFSAVHTLHHERVPVHDYFDLAIRPILLPDDLVEKAFIAYCRNDRITNCGGEWENGLLKTQVRSFGSYCIMIDDQPPTIKPVTFKYNMKGLSRMSFRIWDNYGTASNLEGLSFRATVDGKWILMELDDKNNLLSHTFDGSIPPGEHQFQLVVTDYQNNQRIFEQTFVR